MSEIRMAGVTWWCYTAGPHDGNGRTEIFTQGCLRAAQGNPCPRCFNPSTWPLYPEEVRKFTPGELAERLYCDMHNDLLTIGGGEPFLQADALADMLLLLRIRRPSLHVIVYSGYTLNHLLTQRLVGPAEDGSEQVLCAPWDALSLLLQVDELIDGEFQEDSKIWNPVDGYIGSSNQRIYKHDDIVEACKKICRLS